MKRPDNAICQNCIAWNKETTECRREAPVFFEGDGWLSWAMWPKTNPTDWCARFCQNWESDDE